MGLNKTWPWADFVDRAVLAAVDRKNLSPLLCQYGGEDSPDVPPLLEWLAHMEATHVSQHGQHEARLLEQLQGLASEPEFGSDLGGTFDERLTRLLQSQWGRHQGLEKPGHAPLPPRHALELHLARARVGWEPAAEWPRAIQLPAMLINPLEPNAANQGQVVALHLTRLSAADWPSCPGFNEMHGRLVRAPAAYLLRLDADFEDALTRVCTLLARTLAPRQEDQPAQVLAWSLRPLPWRGQQMKVRLLELGGNSLGAWMALASLHHMVDLLRPEFSSAWGGVLREIDLTRLSGTAGLGTTPDDAADPLDWPLEFIGGASNKLIELKQVVELNNAGSFKTRAVLLKTGQQVAGNQHLKLLEGQTLADWLRQAHSHSGMAMGQNLNTLHQALLELPLADHSGRHQRTSLLPEVLEQDFSAELLAPAPAGASTAVLRMALKVNLLMRYAHWAGGHYQPFGSSDGQPVLLASHFHPIQIEPQAVRKVGARGHLREEDPLSLPSKEEVNGLSDLLAIDGVDRWVCTAAPAGGKTTLLAAFEMESAHAALQRLNDTGTFGTVALWLPLRWCATSQVQDAPAAIGALWDLAVQQHPSWARALRQAAEFGDWSVFKDLGVRVVWLLDGVNEMPAQSQTHRGQLIGWMDALLAKLRLASGGCIAQCVYTIRTHARQGMLSDVNEAVLQPWDRQRRRDYMMLRLRPDHQRLLSALDDAIEKDPEPDERKLMATPGHLAAQVTLLLSGLVTRPAQHRAELFCTLLWVRLHQEVTRGHIARELLSDEELTRLDHLEDNLQREGGWRWPTRLEPRSLIATLARLAVSQQHLDPQARQRRQRGEEDTWAMTVKLEDFRNPPRLEAVALDIPGDAIRSCQSLLNAAEQLNLVRRDVNGNTLSWMNNKNLSWNITCYT